MKKTQTIMGEEAREKLKVGASQVAGPVALTMGAKGRNVVYNDWGINVTNDGVSIARRINPEDPFESMGADLIKQAAEKTNEEAGDGTSTTIKLSEALIEAGFEAVKNGADPMTVKRDLEVAKDEAITLLTEGSKEVTDLFQVANVSVENEYIAKVVSDAVTKAGVNGNVVVEESSGYDIEKTEVNGYFYEKGFISPYMVTNPEKMEAVLNDPAVILTDRVLNLNKELMGVLSQIHQSGKTSVLILADKVEGELLQSLIANKMKGLIVSVVVRRPNTIDELEDIATMTGATAVTSDKGIKEILYSHVGSCKRAVVRKDEIVIIGNDEINPNLSIRVANLQTEVKENKNNQLAKERLAKLVNGVVMLRVGAKTEAERHYLKLKVDDAVGACKAALEEGIVEGGGVSLHLVAGKIKNPILAKALRAPYEQILKNAGIAIPEKLVRYNVLTGEVVTDMFKEGIVDPTKVERCSIENAVSLAGTLLTVETVIADVVQKENTVPQM